MYTGWGREAQGHLSRVIEPEISRVILRTIWTDNTQGSGDNRFAPEQSEPELDFCYCQRLGRKKINALRGGNDRATVPYYEGKEVKMSRQQTRLEPQDGKDTSDGGTALTWRRVDPSSVRVSLNAIVERVRYDVCVGQNACAGQPNAKSVVTFYYQRKWEKNSHPNSRRARSEHLYASFKRLHPTLVGFHFSPFPPFHNRPPSSSLPR